MLAGLYCVGTATRYNYANDLRAAARSKLFVEFNEKILATARNKASLRRTNEMGFRTDRRAEANPIAASKIDIAK